MNILNINKDKDGLLKSIFTAYFILLLHVFLLAGVGLTVVLFKGVYHYLPYIMALIGILVLGIAWIFYRKMRKNTSSLSEMLSTPQFQDRTVEVKLMGGLASFKIKAKENNNLLIDHNTDHTTGLSHGKTHFIESSLDKTKRKMIELDTLYEKDLITRNEFDTARQNIIQGVRSRR
ncbi:MAG: hypothetical protein B6230_03795 [Desulfobacteraceae bacterium 4572_89]|nr:MAG: hypothetical protein B6230_03795 [Desulfobacteraceae bacterium 4572_89]